MTWRYEYSTVALLEVRADFFYASYSCGLRYLPAGDPLEKSRRISNLQLRSFSVRLSVNLCDRARVTRGSRYVCMILILPQLTKTDERDASLKVCLGENTILHSAISIPKAMLAVTEDLQWQT